MKAHSRILAGKTDAIRRALTTMGVRLEFRPLTRDLWQDLETLFGPRGAYSGCWCIWWRCSRKEFADNGNEGNKRAFRHIVNSGDVPGILAYADSQPVGWCSVAPRDSYPSLQRSPTLKSPDGRPCWSIVCLFISRSWRGRGISRALVHAAVAHVRAAGGRLVEAYPTLPRGRRLSAVSSYMGTPVIFEHAGFRECARPSEARVIMRRELRPRKQ